MVSTLAAARVASRWLQTDPDQALTRARELPEIDAVLVCDDLGWGVLVGSDLRPLLTDPGVPLASSIADFGAGWRTDYLGAPTPEHSAAQPSSARPSGRA